MRNIKHELKEGKNNKNKKQNKKEEELKREEKLGANPDPSKLEAGGSPPQNRSPFLLLLFFFGGKTQGEKSEMLYIISHQIKTKQKQKKNLGFLFFTRISILTITKLK